MPTRSLPARRTRRTAAPALACVALALAACTEEGLEDGSQSGGGAGDEEATLLLQSLAGVYDLTGPWRGEAGDVAYLVLREPDGRESEALLYDVDETAPSGSCYENPRSGTARVDEFAQNDPTANDVFLDGFFDFDRATVFARADGTLVIEYIDSADLDRDGDRDDDAVYEAPSIDGLAEVDFTPRC